MTAHISSDRQNTAAVPVLDHKMALVLLGMVVLAGVAAGLIRLFLGLGTTTNLSDPYTWGIWIGFDFTLIAFAGAGFTMAAVVHILHQHKYEEAVRPAILAGLMGYVAVLLLLVLDLGRPDRFYNFLLFWNLHSPLFEVSWCILLYTTVLVVETSPFLLERLRWKRLLRLVALVMVPVTILGVTLSSLHQSTLGTLYLNMPHRLHPLWFTPILSLLFFVSSIMAGLSMAMLAYMAAVRIARRPIHSEVVTGLGRIVGWVAVLYAVLKLGDLLVAGELGLMFQANMMSLLMWLEIGIGAIVPALLLLLARTRTQRWVQIAAPLMVLFGVLMNRFNATMFAQLLPDGTTYVPHVLEWLSTIGILAAAAIAWYLGIRFLAIFDSHAEAGKD